MSSWAKQYPFSAELETDVKKRRTTLWLEGISFWFSYLCSFFSFRFSPFLFIRRPPEVEFKLGDSSSAVEFVECVHGQWKVLFFYGKRERTLEGLRRKGEETEEGQERKTTLKMCNCLKY